MLRDIVEGEEIEILVTEFAHGFAHERPGFGGEATEELPRFFAWGDRGKNVGRGLPFDAGRTIGFLEFVRGGMTRAPIGDSSGHDEPVAPRQIFFDGGEHVGRGGDPDEGDVGGRGQGDGTGDESDGVAGRAGRLGDGGAHFAAGAITDEADGIDGFARGASSHQDVHDSAGREGVINGT